jgi:predicted PurR-regulated permease PerM
MAARKSARSPKWNSTAKLLAGLVMVSLVAAVLIRFNYLIGPLLLAFILSYLLHPLASRLAVAAKIPWRASVNLIFAVFVILAIWLSILAGSAAVDQLRALVDSAQTFFAGLPQFAATLGSQAIKVGPFTINFAELETALRTEFNLDFTALSQQLISSLQPLLGQAGSLVGVLATSAFGILARSLFVFLIAYFLLIDSEDVPTIFAKITVPGHDADIGRLSRELSQIWGAFLRGQLVIISMIVITYFLLMTILGVHNAIGLALLTGLAKFVPYVGPLVAGSTAALVAYFQGGNYLGIEPFTFSLIVVVGTLVLDQIFDNFVTPRIYGKALGVHPAAVLVAALVAASLLGFVGLLLAAPVLASLQLFATYALRKMLDQDPWPKPEAKPASIEVPLARPLQQLYGKLRAAFSRRRKRNRRK